MADRLAPGDPAPEFALPDDSGGTTSLTALRGNKVVVYFYPAAGTPGCTAEACDFRDNLGSLRGAGYAVLGISRDDPSQLARFRDEQGLTFPLLADADHAVHAAYGAWGPKNGSDEPGPNRSTFVLDENGVVTQAMYDVAARGHVAELRKTLGLDA